MTTPDHEGRDGADGSERSPDEAERLEHPERLKPNLYERIVITMGLVIITALTGSIVLALSCDDGGAPRGSEAAAEGSVEGPPRQRGPVTPKVSLSRLRKTRSFEQGRLQGLELKLRRAREGERYNAAKRLERRIKRARRRIGELDRQIAAARAEEGAAVVSPDGGPARRGDGG